MRIEIRSYFNGAVLFLVEADSWRLAVEAAIKSGADLYGADLYGADLRGASLRGANLRGASLRGADLYGASLLGANLRGANLRDANLRDANLRGADLYGASLRGANLRGANLRDANLRDANGITRLPIQIGGHRDFIQTTQDGKLRIGCEIHSFEKWREIAEKLGAKNKYSALDIEIYKAHIEHVEKISRLLWNAKKEKAAAK